jgi:hypothetical protein
MVMRAFNMNRRTLLLGTAYGGRKDPFDVLLVQKDGSSQVFKSYA